MKPADSHCARSWPSVKTCAMSGTATLTIVEAMIEATVPIITVARTRQRYDAPKRRSRAAREWSDSTGDASDLLVERQRQELGELVARAHVGEDLGGPVELADEAARLDLRQLLG